MSDNSRLAKNTMFLYLRLGIIMIIKLYVTRVLLEALGIDDYGVWNLISAFVVSFQFVSAPIVVSTQRFLNYDMGQGGKKLTQIFNLSLELVLTVGILLIIGLETAGNWILNSKLNFPPDTLPVARILYQLSIFTLFFQLVQKPFESTVIAHEKMSFYAYISLFEAFMLLCVTVVLKSDLAGSKLLWYGWMNLSLYVMVFFIYAIFCRVKFTACRIRPTWNKKLAREIAVFSGWNLFGGLSSMTANQGVNVLLNMFFGVTVNAAFGISQQVKSATSSLIGNLQKAFDPQIVKNYSTGNVDRFHFLTNTVIRLSYALGLALVFPLIYNFDFILKIWLGNNVPEFTYWFSVITLLQMLLVSIGTPVDTVIFSTGKIKSYQLWLSGEIFLNIIICYILFKLRFGSMWAFIVRLGVEILIVATRLLFLRRVGLGIRYVLLEILLPVAAITALSCGVCVLVMRIISFSNGWFQLVVSTTIFETLLFMASWRFMFNKDMRLAIKDKIMHKIKRS